MSLFPKKVEYSFKIKGCFLALFHEELSITQKVL